MALLSVILPSIVLPLALLFVLLTTNGPSPYVNGYKSYLVTEWVWTSFTKVCYGLRRSLWQSLRVLIAPLFALQMLSTLGLLAAPLPALLSPPSRPARARPFKLKHGFLTVMLRLSASATPINGEISCQLPKSYNSIFLDGIQGIEDKLEEEVISGLNEVGLGPLGDSFLPTAILDLKGEVLEKLFGNATERQEWIDDTSDLLDLGPTLLENFNNDVLGAVNGELDVSCTEDVEAQRFEFVLGVNSTNPNWSLTNFSDAQVTFLPDSFPSFDVDSPTVELDYEISVPLVVNLKLKKFFLGEVTVHFATRISAGVSKELPILPSQNVSFGGSFDLNATFDYSSIDEFSLSGSLNAELDATASGTGVANLGVRAFDDDIFDSKPRECIHRCPSHVSISPTVPYFFLPSLSLSLHSASVSFNFDLCKYTERLKDAISSFSFGGELENILDNYLDLSDNEIFGSSLGSLLVTRIKDAIVTLADSKVNMIKGGVEGKIDGIPCSGRRLDVFEVGHDGSQRMLQDDLTFDALADAILDIDSSIQYAAAGYFADRGEVAFDVTIRLEPSLETDEIQSALDGVFARLDTAKEMFGVADDESANVTGLLDTASAIVEFELSFR